MSKIQLAVVDDHNLFRKGMISILQQVPDFEVVMEATNGQGMDNRTVVTASEVITN